MLREKRRWMQQFSSRHGDSDLLLASAKDIDLRTLLDAVGTAPFLAEKRLLLIDGIPRLSAEECELLIRSMHAQCILVFLEPEPDGRLASVKALQKLATIKDFELKKGKALKVFLQNEAKLEGVTVDDDALDRLLAIVGDDEAMLRQEIRKCALFVGNRCVTRQDIEQLAVPGGEQEIWELSRLLGSGNAQMSLLFVHSLLQRGEDAFSIWNILLWIIRQYVSVWSLVQEGVHNSAEIARRSHVPFPSAKTLAPVASRTSCASLRSLLEQATKNDVELKTGGYRSTAESPEEVQCLLDLLVLKTAIAMKNEK